ncbi:MAG: serine hydrolase [Humidesulfovibrio sp.]|uniref:serine hydrolase n=1 Tax=Humidesulfovibrio sp. TaxID=2910988 RepID=UPI002734AFDA|nr:serine hydrolase [Humidesulfovibrio sp.]MDP2848812.1 serine hydrolase [Humidesulfovibrio sp.]
MREKSRVFILTMLLIMLAARSVHAAQQPGALGAKSVIAMDLGTGRILYEQNADQQIPPASLTKVLTLYLTFEALQEHRLSLTDTVLVSPEATQAGGSRMNIRSGERVIVRELVKGIAVASGNDACWAMAQHLSGGEDVHPFVNAMNAKARELGMTDTVFKNPNGMPADGQLTTARDMLKLSASYLRRFPQSLTFHSMTTYVHNNHNHHNANRLLNTYEGVDGLKTGYVRASGYNNVVTAKRGDTRIVAVVLGARSAGARAVASQKLLDLAFQRLNQGQSVATLEEQKGRGVLPASLAHTAPRVDPDLKAAQQVADQRANQVRTSQPVAQAANAVAEEKPATQEMVQRKTGKSTYAIQESSFQSRLKAERRAQHLEKRGLPVKVVATNLGGSKWYRVLVGPYASANAAKKTREKMLTRGSVTEE